ncbi:hypothetical protein KEM55_000432 [Ascosphaera atra]|nr:hypothetical protein KEM55_000432 [Ascosphaera atra]
MDINSVHNGGDRRRYELLGAMDKGSIFFGETEEGLVVCHASFEVFELGLRPDMVWIGSHACVVAGWK